METITVSRYEYKYLLSPAEAPPIRRFLMRYCASDDTAGSAWYGIHSLYLDTRDYRLFTASAAKEVCRLKLRVRSYASGDGPLKFEVKRRFADMVTKHSLVVPREQWQRLAEDGAVGIAGIDGLATSEFARLIHQLHAVPKVLVNCERQAFRSVVDDYVRVTFDRRIQCQPMSIWNVSGQPLAWRMVDHLQTAPGETASPYVLELKFKVAPPVWLHDLVTTFQLTRRGFSKYVRAVQKIVPDIEPAWDLRMSASASRRLWRIA